MFSINASLESTKSVNSATSQLSSQQGQRTKQRFNSLMIDCVLDGKSKQEISEKFRGANHVWSAVCSPTQTSVLHLAAILGRIDLIEEIIRVNSESSPDDPLTHTDHADTTALHFAAWKGNTECLKTLLGTSCRTHINTRTIPPRSHADRIEFPVKWEDSFFHNHERVKLQLPDIPEGSTPLHAAATRCHPECFQLLVDAGASLSIRDDRGFLAFEVLGEHFELETEHQVQPLRNCHAPRRYIRQDIRPRSTVFSLSVSTESNNSEVHDEIIDEEPQETFSPSQRTSIFAERADRIIKGLRLSKFEGSGNSDALHSAVASKCELLVDFHLSQGADICALNAKGETVLFVALMVSNWSMLEKLLTICRDLANTPNSSGEYPIHTAAYIDNTNEAIALLLEYDANPLKLTAQHSSILHLAASYGKTDLLRELLGCRRDNPIYQLLEEPDSSGKTPLHHALECSSKEKAETSWNILTKAGASIDACTNEGWSVLHTAIYYNQSLLPLILRGGHCKVLDTKDNSGYTPLLFAVKHSKIDAVETLIAAGARLDARVFVERLGDYCSALHLAASMGDADVIFLLLKGKPDLLHQKTALGWPALYVAAYNRQYEAVSKLLSHGADLAYVVKLKERKTKLILTEMVENIRQAGSLIEKVLDSKITKTDGLLETHPDCEITVNYDVLIPEVDDTLQSSRQMRAIDAFLNCGDKSCKQLIGHPLVRSFLIKRWAAIWPCYWFLVILHVLMVVAHTGLITGAVWGDLHSRQLLISRFTLVIVALFIAVKEIIHASQMFRIYISDSQTWLKWAYLILAVFVALENPEYIHATTHPKALEELSSAQSTLALIAKEKLWVRHVVAISALITWIELLLILSQTPTLGSQVQMFYKVAVSVTKFLLSFSILLFAFSFAFMVEFRGKPPFATILGSLGETLVMMTSEFNYNDLFTDEDGLLSRIPFFLFLLFVPIVLMNLLVGLAVSDITYLEDQGRRRVLEQQAAFLIVLENVIYSTPVQTLLPEKWLSSLSRLISVDPDIVLYPGRPRSSGRMARLMDFPEDLQEDLIRIAKKEKLDTTY